jgi:hypothetical protein
MLRARVRGAIGFFMCVLPGYAFSRLPLGADREFADCGAIVQEATHALSQAHDTRLSEERKDEALT